MEIKIDERNRTEMINVINSMNDFIQSKIRTILFFNNESPEDNWVLSSDCSTLIKQELQTEAKEEQIETTTEDEQ